MKALLTVADLMVALSGCTGNSCNPPPILLPILVPMAVADRIRHPPKPHIYASISGGDTIDRAFVLRGAMTPGALRSHETYFYWCDHDYRIPGSARGYFVAQTAPRKIEGVVFQDNDTGKETTYFFDVTDVQIEDESPNRAPLVAPMPVTPAPPRRTP
jgi:hypothetical protein